MHLLSRLVLLSLLLRVLVPVGLMPASTTQQGGWHLQLCPTSMSAAAMSALLGDHHHHHHHHGADDEPVYVQCDLGNALGADVTFSAPLLLQAVTASEPRSTLHSVPVTAERHRPFQPRDPPHLRHA